MNTKIHYSALKVVRAPTDGSGWFAGMASTTDLDWDGERFAPGAWAKTVGEWAKTGQMPPLFLNHRVMTDDADDIIGRLTRMEDRADGLYVEAQLDLSNTKAQKAYERLLSGALDSMSVGFAYAQRHVEDDAVVIDEADLIEVSLTPVPANPYARVSLVKSAKTNLVDRVVTIARENGINGKRLDLVREVASRARPDNADGIKQSLDLLMSGWEIADVRHEIDNAGTKATSATDLDVDRIVREVKIETENARAARVARLRHERENHERVLGLAQVSEADRDAREIERREREQAEQQARWAAKDAEIAEIERLDAERREMGRRDPNQLQL